ncbi:MAG: zinc metalloprotease HtpX [Armatimonadota bacterium]
MVVMTGILLSLGNLFGGRNGLFIMLTISLVINWVSYYYSDKIVLSMYGAKPISQSDAPDLYQKVQMLCSRADIPMPKLYILPEQQPNAFATGRSPQYAAVAVTQGLLQVCDSREVEGVIAHELAHIRNRDTLLMTVVASMATAIMMIAHMARWAAIFGGVGRDRDNNPLGLLFAIIVAPIAATMVQLAISRQREFYADETGAKLAGDPMGLANALVKIEQVSQRQQVGFGDPATAHMFIMNPLKAEGISGLFRTHPSTKQRVMKLREMASLDPLFQ